MLRQVPHLGLGHPGLGEHGDDPELPGRLPAGAVVALVVLVRPVDDAGVALLLGELRQVRVQGALAEVAAVRGVAGVVGVVELPRVHDQVLDPERLGELSRQVELRGQVGLVVRGDGEDPVLRERPRRDRERQRGVDPAGERHERAPARGEDSSSSSSLLANAVATGFICTSSLARVSFGEPADRLLRRSCPGGRRDRRPSRSPRLSMTRVSRFTSVIPSASKVGKVQGLSRTRASRRSATRKGDGAVRRPLAGRRCPGCSGRRPARRGPWSSAWWSRKAHDWGVQPRAPGISSHPCGRSRSGLPVSG